MSQTTDEPGRPNDEAADAPGTTQTDPGPQLNRDQVRNLDQLRRSTSDRYIAGVAGGLGRHFGIDPTILRVVFAAACLFGGAGLILYAAVWLFVPEDDRAQAPIHVSGETRRLLILGAAAIAVLGLIGDSWGGVGWHVAWPLGVVAVIVAVIAGSRRRSQPPAATPYADRYAGQYAGQYAGAPVPPSSVTPSTPAYTPPRRPRRTGLVLFWPTLALVAVGWGLLGIYDIDHHVAAGAWAALPLAVVGAMLALGAFVGRPGGLILAGLLLVPALSVTTIADNVQWNDDTQRYTPTSTAGVRDSYQIDNGRMVLDLSKVQDPAALRGRDLDLRADAGEIQVILPPGVWAGVDASIDFAGDIEVGRHERSGLGPDLSRVLYPPGTDSQSPGMNLTVRVRVGHIEIDTED